MLVDVATCEKTPLSHLYIKTIICQDRLGTNIGKTPKKMPFSAPFVSSSVKDLHAMMQNGSPSIATMMNAFELRYLHRMETNRSHGISKSVA